VKWIFVIVGLIVLAAGCSSHPSTPAGSQSVSSTKSYSDGEKAGESISLPNETATQMQASCEVTAQKQMPSSDTKSSWMGGCVAGIIQAEIQAGDSG
jgi:hypothetical protein